jgi:rubrerythrin
MAGRRTVRGVTDDIEIRQTLATALSRGREATTAEGGDAACWLDRVCDECGALVDGPDEMCPRCGKPLAGTNP